MASKRFGGKLEGFRNRLNIPVGVAEHRSRNRRCKGRASTCLIERFGRWVRSALPRPVASPHLPVRRQITGKVTPLTGEDCTPQDWTRDGRAILCVNQPATRLSMLSPANGPKLQTILDTSYRAREFRFSPDGHYVAYASNESGSMEVYVAAFPSFAPKRKISSGGGTLPIWGKSGKEIFYYSPDRMVMNAEIRTGSNLESGIPKPLFKSDGGFVTTSNGKRFLFNESLEDLEPQKPEITLVLNWMADLRLH
jgi:hypothetical protein